MACQEVESWTLGGLWGSFLDLVLAYFLLCISAFVFFASKLLKIFWVYLPCPCNGFLGYRNSEICLHKLLNEWPIAKIYAVKKLVKSRFPFDIRFRDQGSNLNQKLIRDVNSGNGVLELEGDSCSSPFSSPRLQSLVDRESGYDGKGKRIVVLKKKSGIRRPRRDSPKSVPLIFPLPYDDRDMRYTSGESSFPLVGREDEPQDNVKAEIGYDIGGRLCQSSRLDGSVCGSKDVEMIQIQEKSPVVGSETETIRMLQEALEKEKAACAALYLELEKERAGASSAADEAMAMIARLQKEKASTEMEVRHYERMIEDKFVYDEEEMDILKEILLRKEKENHLLEKEVEAYRQMNFYCDGEEQQQDGDYLKCNIGCAISDKEPAVYDVHVIDSKTESSKGERRSSVYEALDGIQDSSCETSGICRSLQDCPSASQEITEAEITPNSMDMCGLPVLDNSRCKTFATGSTTISLSVANTERSNIDTEVRLLTERLQMLEQRKEKLASSAELGKGKTPH